MGGGLAGVTASIACAGEGRSVLIVERQSFLGGHAASFCCKAAEKCLECGLCAAMGRFRSLAGNRLVEKLFCSEVSSFSGEMPPFSAEITVRQNPVDPLECTSCGLCEAECPAGAVTRNHEAIPPQFYVIDGVKCLRSAGESCSRCADLCPAKCIDFSRTSKIVEVNPRAVILAAGYDSLDALSLPQYGYGSIEGVITAHELEGLLASQGELSMAGPEGRPRRIAFIQCAGSRNPHKGRDYCSTVCCPYALRLARMIRHRDPAAEVTVFYIDLQPVGKSHGAFIEGCRGDEKLRLLKALPARLSPVTGGVSIEYEEMAKGTNVVEQFDLVVLSTGITPSGGNHLLESLYGISLTRDGFIKTLEDGSTGREGVFAAGSSTAPMDMEGTIISASAAAARVISYLGGERN
ncbi:MAG: FAD-dependent oxidoreductase [Candidatus Eremiobacteraeota bacterium]|nr:FAD-dependent oxidoreductase [Candidatus Eremiobacteraeota bacterium]